MSKYLSYDIEIFNEIPEGDKPDFTKIIPSVAAFCTTEDDTKFFYDEPYMTKETAQRLVREMMEYQNSGYKIFTWSGLSFDFRLLSAYSGMVEECAELALNHVDGMFLVMCHNGYRLGLDAALKGAGLETKLHVVTLNDQTVFSEMNGSHAPRLWREGEFSAVKNYLRMDVVQPLKLADTIEKTGIIRWNSKTGRLNLLRTKMLTVREALKLELPDTSWMDNPLTRESFYDWIPQEVLQKELA